MPLASCTPQRGLMITQTQSDHCSCGHCSMQAPLCVGAVTTACSAALASYSHVYGTKLKVRWIDLAIKTLLPRSTAVYPYDGYLARKNLP